MRDRAFRNILLLSLGFHLLACFFSDGFFHYDEHFREIETANFKLGQTPEVELGWEHDTRVRPWLQPGIFYVLTKASYAVGIENPFVIAFFWRFIAALLGFAAATALSFCCFRWFEDRRRQLFAIGILHLAWFIPYLHVRPSSESFASSFFVFGVTVFCLRESKAVDGRSEITFATSVLLGLLMGLTFEIRFHLIFMIIGFMAWLMWVARVRWTTLMIVAGSSLVMVALGTLIDHWGYGEWTFTTWNYFKMLFVKGALANDGVEPWWFYIHYLVVILPPLSLLLAVMTVLGMKERPWHVLVWSSVPFVLFHTVVGHKEPRYLFPVYVFAPVMAAYSIERYGWIQNLFRRKLAVRAFLALNFVTLFHLSSTTCKRQMAVYQFVYGLEPEPFEYVVLGDDPFRPSGLQPRFYTRGVKRIAAVSLESQALPYLAASPIWFVTEWPIQNQEVVKYCQKRWTNSPSQYLGVTSEEFLRRMKVRSWTLYSCGRPGQS